MDPGRINARSETGQVGQFVSDRFLTDFFSALSRQGVEAAELLGDLPVSMDEAGVVRGPVEWSHFADFMRRLEHHLGGSAGLEACGESIGELKPAAALRSLAGAATSAHSLYAAAAKWALRRALPGIQVRLDRIDDAHLEIHARLADGLRPCPQVFHFATGGARCLPGVIGLENAVVSASVGDFEARYRIALPPSRSIFARIRRVSRAVFSAGSVVRFLETQQLELHAQNDELRRAHDALAASERRYRAMTDAAADVLCEIDETGHLVYVSAAVEDLIGYTPDQVTHSHYRLWVPSAHRAQVDEHFAHVFQLPPGQSARTVTRLHAESQRSVDVEITGRCHVAADGSRRVMCIIRDLEGADTTTASTARGSAIEALRERVRPPRANHSSEPLSASTLEASATDPGPNGMVERSLAQLLARLDETALGATTSSGEDLPEATRRITRIVDAAVAEADPQSIRFEWVETRKLVDGVREGVARRNAANEDDVAVELRTDLADAPSEIWIEAGLLEVALESLIDRAARNAPRLPNKRPEIELCVARVVDSPNVRLSLLTSLPEVSDPAASPPQARTANDEADLALAIAADAVEALGGRLTRAAGSTARIELIQPPHGT